MGDQNRKYFLDVIRVSQSLLCDSFLDCVSRDRNTVAKGGRVDNFRKARLMPGKVSPEDMSISRSSFVSSPLPLVFSSFFAFAQAVIKTPIHSTQSAIFDELFVRP